MFRGRGSVLAFALILAGAAAAGAQSPWPGGGGPYLGLDLQLGTPSAARDVFRTAFPGLSLRFIASPNLEFSLDYAFMDIEYYYPESPAGPWHGPVPWSSMPARFEDFRDGWIFYQTRHYLAPHAWYLAPLGRYDSPFAIRLGAGPALSFVIASESARFYPGLSEAFEQFASGFEAWLGLSLHAGAEYQGWRHVRLGAEYLFVVDTIDQAVRNLGRDPWGWIAAAGNVLLYAGVRL